MAASGLLAPLAPHLRGGHRPTRGYHVCLEYQVIQKARERQRRARNEIQSPFAPSPRRILLTDGLKKMNAQDPLIVAV